MHVYIFSSHFLIWTYRSEVENDLKWKDSQFKVWESFCPVVIESRNGICLQMVLTLKSEQLTEAAMPFQQTCPGSWCVHESRAHTHTHFS